MYKTIKTVVFCGENYSISCRDRLQFQTGCERWEFRQRNSLGDSVGHQKRCAGEGPEGPSPFLLPQGRKRRSL